MGNIIEQVRNEILLAIKNDDLVLPTLPEVALRVRDVAMDPEATMEKLAAVIGNDPSLCARLIKVANSPLIRASRPIENLHMALSRLGMDYTCNIATGLAMEQMFQATSDIIDKRMRDIWNRSAEVAGISHVLAKQFTALRPDQATLGGLVHKIGALPILTYAENNPALQRDSFTLDTIIERLSPAIGNKILSTWEFPEEIRKVPSEHLNFGAEKEIPDYADVVSIAVLQNYVGSSHPLAKIDYSQVKAFDRIGLPPDVITGEVEDLTEEMNMAMEMLK